MWRVPGRGGPRPPAAAQTGLAGALASTHKALMRNILIEASIQGVAGPAGLEVVAVFGHAYGVDRVRVSLGPGQGTAAQVVPVDARGHWQARFERGGGTLPPGLACGAVVRACAADAADPEGVYSSVEAPIECERPARR